MAEQENRNDELKADQAAAAAPAEAQAEPAAPAAPQGPDLDTIKPGDLLKNTRDGHIYKVLGLSGRKVQVRDFLGAERVFQFMGQFETPSQEDGAEFEARRVKPQEPKVSLVKTETARKETDAFAAYMEKIKQSPGGDVERFQAFWKKAVELFGDEPSLTWRMRVVKNLQPSPTLRLRHSKTMKWKDSVMLWGLEKLTIIVLRDFCIHSDREECRAVFPDDNDAYGKSVAVTIPYAELDDARMATYLGCMKTILKAFGA